MKRWLFALSMSLALNANADSMAVNIDALQVPVRTIFPTHIPTLSKP